MNAWWSWILTALGVKTIETRTWPAPKSIIGQRIAIHAAQHRPSIMWLPPLSHRLGPEADEHDAQTWHVIDTITDPAFQGPKPQGTRVPKRATTPTLFFPHAGPHGRPWDRTLGTSATEQGTAMYLPLGAIVATATVTGTLPMVDMLDPHPDTGAIVIHHGTNAWVYEEGATVDDVRNIADQLPYGDFTPGRFGWLLNDIEPLDEPVPFRGGQGLSRTWEPAA